MNKTTNLISLLSILISFQVFSQNTDFQKGTIILANGDSINCEIKVYSANKFVNSNSTITSNKIVYKLNNDKSKIEFSDVDYFFLEKMIIDSIDAFKNVKRGPRTVSVKYKKQVYVYGTGNEKLKFNKFELDITVGTVAYKDIFFATKVLDGKFDLYERYDHINTNSVGSSNLFTINYYLMTEQGLKKIGKAKKSLPAIYNNCPELIKEMESKEFEKKPMIDKISMANELCN